VDGDEKERDDILREQVKPLSEGASRILVFLPSLKQTCSLYYYDRFKLKFQQLSTSFYLNLHCLISVIFLIRIDSCQLQMWLE